MLTPPYWYALEHPGVRAASMHDPSAFPLSPVLFQRGPESPSASTRCGACRLCQSAACAKLCRPVSTACPRVIRNQRSHARHTVSHLLPAQTLFDDGAHSNVCCGRAATLKRCVAQQRRSPRPRIVRPAPRAVFRSTADQQSPGGHEYAADVKTFIGRGSYLHRS